MLRDAAIEAHNADSTKTWTMGHNHLSDMTEAEYKKMLGGRPSLPNSDAPEEVGATCVDNNGSCPGWAAGGECTRNPGYMIPNCKKSCGQCNPTPPAPTCTDLNNECSSWSQQGWCQRNTNSFMKTNCKKSCNNCTGPSPGPTPTPGNGVDWRNKGAVNAVKNQGSCGSCWSFSANMAMEGAHFVKTGSLLSFAEQQLVDCSKQNHGCSGGW